MALLSDMTGQWRLECGETETCLCEHATTCRQQRDLLGLVHRRMEVECGKLRSQMGHHWRWVGWSDYLQVGMSSCSLPLDTTVRRRVWLESRLSWNVMTHAQKPYWCRIHLWFRWMGGSASKVDDVTALPCRADDVTASHIQDGGYALLWQRYDNNKMAAICYYGNVMPTKIYNKFSLWLYCWRCRIHL